ncbi:MAG: FHA domain-containing protein [Planctomycetota bacterium]|nr:FHA domain-containing protein [Planctomycetota bacterium]
MAKLEILNGKSAGETVDVPEGESLEIGTKRKAFLRLRDPGVSYTHALVSLTGAKLSIQDKKSGTGTFIGDTKLEGEGHLESGGSFKIGDIEIRFTADAPAAEAPAPEAPAPEAPAPEAPAPEAPAPATADQSELIAKLAEVEKAKNTLTLERKNLFDELETTKAQLEEAEEIASDGVEHVSAVEDRCAELEAEVAKLEDALKGSETKLREEYEDRVKELEEDSKNARNEVIKLKKELVGALSTQTELEERFNDSETVVNQLKAQLEEIKDAAKEQSKKYEKGLSDARKAAKAARSRSLSKNQVSSDADVISKSAGQDDLKDAVLAFFEGNGSPPKLPEDKSDQSVDELRAEITRTASEIAELKKAGAIIPVDIEDLEARLQARDQELKVLKEDYNSKCEEVEEINADFRETLDELEKLKG